MDRTHFLLQVKRLHNTYGPKSYNEERGELLWREVQDLSNYWMTKAVDLFVGSHRQAPLLPEFREEIAKERERLWREKKSKKGEVDFDCAIANYSCDDCRGTGMYLDQDNYAFRCHCPAGEDRGDQIPRLRGSLRMVR